MSVLDAFSLAGKVSVVTGGNRGIGRALAGALAEAGSDVALLVRDPDRAAPVVAELAGKGVRAVAVRADVTDAAEVDAAVPAVVDALGRVDVLVNNAGLGEPMPAEEESMDHFRRVVDVNLHGLFQLCQMAFEPMAAAGSGSIVNVASMLGLVGSAPIKQASYCASKGAVINLTRELGCQWARKGIRVNGIAPGWFPSEMTADMWGDAGSEAFVSRNTPMARPGDVHELDGALLFLAGDASSYVTGQTIVVDGGWTAR